MKGKIILKAETLLVGRIVILKPNKFNDCAKNSVNMSENWKALDSNVSRLM